MRQSIYFSEKTKEVLESYTSDFKTEKARENYYGRVASICDFCKKDFLDLRQTDVQRYFDSLSSASHNSRHMWLGIFRVLAKEADRAYGYNSLDSFRIRESLQRDSVKDPGDLPSLQDIDTLLVYLRDRGFSQLLCMVTLMIETGLSVREIRELSCSNVCQDENGTVFLRFEPVSPEGIARYVPLRAETAETVARLGSGRRDMSPGSPLFVNQSGQSVSERMLEIMLRRACSGAGIAPVRMRDLKDIARAAMFAGGAGAKEITLSTGATSRWFFRLDRVISSLKTSAASHSMLKVVNQDVQTIQEDEET